MLVKAKEIVKKVGSSSEEGRQACWGVQGQVGRREGERERISEGGRSGGQASYHGAPDASD